ncbi:hypothetical protein M231_07059 [Tremella mesenterica]|uniref:Importin N-terminal domain-containing protein n=1 Tax=Tremella mesenterica TaxID=5217 RepID=A0A4Q1BCZ4_TREME|nr:hypothetical protein M231_07059 [Tremella mesenterica]
MDSQPQSVDIRALLHAVTNPTSNQGYVRDQALLTDQLKEPGFLIALQECAADKSLSQPQRLLASIITGRELKIKWRNKSIIPPERKGELRQRLFSFLEEEDITIARPQLALFVAICRTEPFPQFAELAHHLVQRLPACRAFLRGEAFPGSSFNIPTVLLNTLWTVNAMVKEFRNVKMAVGEKIMNLLDQEVAGPVGQLMADWAEAEMQGGANLVLEEAGRYAFKIRAKLSQWFWFKKKHPHTVAPFSQLSDLVDYTVQSLPLIQKRRLYLISQPSTEWNSDRPRLLRSLAKYLRAIGKWWRAMMGSEPKMFCTDGRVIDGIAWWWSTSSEVALGSEGAVVDDGIDSDDVSYPKRFILLGLLLFKDVLPILAHDRPDVFDGPFILRSFHLLLDKLLPLSPADLEKLEDSPEEWLIAESTEEEAWVYEYRPCAERVLIALNNACRQLMTNDKILEGEMVKIFVEMEVSSPNDLPAILRREAMYCALGRLSRSMSKMSGINFETFLRHWQETWASQNSPLHRILKRRLAWLITEWVKSNEDIVQSPLLWQVLLQLLTERGEASDMAVRLSAALAVKQSVDAWGQPISVFLPFLHRTSEALVHMMAEAETLEGKRYVNQTLGVVVERVGDEILPLLPSIAQSIPALWQGASDLEGEWLFKSSLVVLTTSLVSVAKACSGSLMELVIPLIEESLQPPAKNYFEEDGLALWQAALYNATSLHIPSIEKGLMRLLPGLLGLLQTDMDQAGSLLRLLESYLLLDAPGLIQTHASVICSTLFQTLSLAKANKDLLKPILETLSLFVRLVPPPSMPLLAVALLDSGLFQHILKALEDDKASGIVLASYLNVLSRIAISSPDTFLQMVAESARRESKDGAKVLEETLDALWRNFDYVGGARERKVVAMGAGALLSTGHSQCLERISGEFMNMFIDVLAELHPPESDSVGQEIGVRSWMEEESERWSEIEGHPEGDRRRQLEESDLAYRIPLRAYIIDVFNRTPDIGPYWAKADPEAVQTLGKYIS